MTTTYTVERLTEASLSDSDVIDYLTDDLPKLADRFGGKYNLRFMDLRELINDCYFMICRRNGVISGHCVMDLYEHCFDKSIKVLYQISLYARPGSGRTAHRLFQEFLDIGRREANHVITMITPQTNIKPSTLTEMGFEEMETLYRLEIK